MKKAKQDPSQVKLKAAKLARRKRRQGKRVVLAVKLLKGINSKMTILQDIIKIQEKEIEMLKAPKPVDEPVEAANVAG